MADDDLDWGVVRKVSPIRIISTRSSDLASQLDSACEKTIFDLTKTFAKHDLLTKGELQGLMTEMVRLFMGHWKKSLEDQNLAGLIELVLEGQKLTAMELSAFLRALPYTFIDRVCVSAIGGPPSGIHAVIAMELAWREG
jgi:hypothetical protein